MAVPQRPWHGLPARVYCHEPVQRRRPRTWPGRRRPATGPHHPTRPGWPCHKDRGTGFQPVTITHEPVQQRRPRTWPGRRRPATGPPNPTRPRWPCHGWRLGSYSPGSLSSALDARRWLLCRRVSTARFTAGPCRGRVEGAAQPAVTSRFRDERRRAADAGTLCGTSGKALGRRTRRLLDAKTGHRKGSCRRARSLRRYSLSFAGLVRHAQPRPCGCASQSRP